MSFLAFEILEIILLLLLISSVWFSIWHYSASGRCENEVAALRLRMDVLEKTAPCEHCRRDHPDNGD